MNIALFVDILLGHQCTPKLFSDCPLCMRKLVSHSFMQADSNFQNQSVMSFYNNRCNNNNNNDQQYYYLKWCCHWVNIIKDSTMQGCSYEVMPYAAFRRKLTLAYNGFKNGQTQVNIWKLNCWVGTEFMQWFLGIVLKRSEFYTKCSEGEYCVTKRPVEFVKCWTKCLLDVLGNQGACNGGDGVWNLVRDILDNNRA